MTRLARPGSRHVHHMPFGATVLDGRVRFRLWAPAQRAVRLRIDGLDDAIAMERLDGGWFQLDCDAIGPGGRYAYQLDDGLCVPDPAARQQAEDVHGWSVVVDPGAYLWSQASWRGRPWRETVLYELHVGSFTAEGTFAAVQQRLDYLAGLGVTAIELMPIAGFAGRRGWGYDGVLPFAPQRAYGSPADLKSLIDAAHGRGLMVFLDVVYNHFGPEGNYLHLYAPKFFDPTRSTPWGAGIDYQQPAVRDFFIHNVLYWLRELRFDGLRFDAVNWIKDRGDDGTRFLKELAHRVRATIAADEPDRWIHLVLENDENDVALLARDEAGAPVYFTAQWNDDWHHSAHLLLTGETDGYYGDYAECPVQCLARAFATGYVYQGEVSAYREGRRRGTPSAHLPPTAFVNFLQNHDQIGNRAFGERLDKLAEPRAIEAFTAALLLAPQVPLLFMAEEWGETGPFRFFCDFHGELAEAVRKGRRNEFRKFARFASEDARAAIPDPNAAATFRASRPDWARRAQPGHRERLALVTRLLALRQARIVPLIEKIEGGTADLVGRDGRLIRVRWRLADGRALALTFNLSGESVAEDDARPGETLFRLPQPASAEAGPLPPFGVLWRLEAPAP